MPNAFSEAQQHLLHRIIHTPAGKWPHQHVFVDNVFPTSFYQQLRQHLPPTEAYTALSLTNKSSDQSYPMRSGFFLDTEHAGRVEPHIAAFWHRVYTEVFSKSFVEAIVHHFSDDINTRNAAEGVDWPAIIHKEMYLIRDTRSEGVKVHTSDRRNLVTLLFYLPEDNRYIAHGTTLYRPKEAAFRCWGGRHYPFAVFEKVTTTSYQPNALFMFVKSNNSFHGVEPIDTENIRRDLMLLYLHR